MTRPSQLDFKKQKGAVLIVALVMLLLLTIIGTASIRDTALQEKMAGNLREQHLAFQAAEAGLRAGEASARALGYDALNAIPDYRAYKSATSTYPNCLTDSDYTKLSATELASALQNYTEHSSFTGTNKPKYALCKLPNPSTISANEISSELGGYSLEYPDGITAENSFSNFVLVRVDSLAKSPSGDARVILRSLAYVLGAENTSGGSSSGSGSGTDNGGGNTGGGNNGGGNDNGGGNTGGGNNGGGNNGGGNTGGGNNGGGNDNGGGNTGGGNNGGGRVNNRN